VTGARFSVNGIEEVGVMKHEIVCDCCGKTFSYEEGDLEEAQELVNCEHYDWPNLLR
jgi:nitrite reductase/ring-hydroxylating ferredoxin subunit